MALEITGTFGHEGRAFLPKLLPLPPAKGSAPARVAEFALAHTRRLSNIKAGMVMAVLRCNADRMEAYNLRVLPGPLTGSS